ncbi:hypothetical protein MD484_g8863, partial [Candolleomyces efflorescens]
MRTRRSAEADEPNTTSATESADHSLEEQRGLVEFDIGIGCQSKTGTLVRSLYNAAADSAIDDFLKKSRFYDLKQRHWKLPRNFSKLLDGNACKPFFSIVSSIVKHFWGDATAEGTRQVVDTHATDFPHVEKDYENHISHPSIAIKAVGPSFELPYSEASDKIGEIGFTNVTTCIEVYVKGDELDAVEQAFRVGIYARQVFIQQPNRKFVRMLFMTEKLVRLFHFDRSGYQCTRLIDFHEEPHTFVRMIVRVSSPNESDLGLDTSIQWEIENGRKIRGTVTTIEGDGKTVKVYPMRYLEPCLYRRSMVADGTVVWEVKDPKMGEKVLIKDFWREEDRDCEGKHLERALGVPGVAQMISYEDNRGTTKVLRGYKDDEIVTKTKLFKNRTLSRVVMEAYGESIFHFTDAKQVLYVFRDAIAGHFNILKAGSLHRNINLMNIVHGKPGAQPGNRGLLVNFDAATFYDPENKSGTPTDTSIGEPSWQSMMALLSRGLQERALIHDDSDDLEAFLYVYAHIIYHRDSNGGSHPPPEEYYCPLLAWQEFPDKPETVAMLKRDWLQKWTEGLTRDIHARWPEPCLFVLRNFRAYMDQIANGIKIHVLTEKPENGEQVLDQMRLNYEKHYEWVLLFFDEAIESLEKAEAATDIGDDGDDDEGGEGGEAAENGEDGENDESPESGEDTEDGAADEDPEADENDEAVENGESGEVGEKDESRENGEGAEDGEADEDADEDAEADEGTETGSVDENGEDGAAEAGETGGAAEAAEDDDDDDDDDAPPSPCPPPGAGGNRLKRRRQDEDEDEERPRAPKRPALNGPGSASWNDPTNPFLNPPAGA